MTVSTEATSSLEAFRRWTHSPDFPEKGRIDYLDGRIEVSMTPEKLETHATPKGKISLFFSGSSKTGGTLGRVYVTAPGCTRDRQVCREPDILFVSLASLRSGRARFVPAESGTRDFIEVEGAADSGGRGDEAMARSRRIRAAPTALRGRGGPGALAGRLPARGD